MHKWFALICGGLLAFTTGCRSTNCTKAFTQSVWGNANEAKFYLDGYKYIVAVRIDEDHWEAQGRISTHHYHGTVVRVYKGDWHIGERVSFAEAMAYEALTTKNTFAGYLGVIITNQRTDSEVDLDIGELFYGDYVNIFDCLFPYSQHEIKR